MKDRVRRKDSDEEMMADVEEGEHVEPTAVAGEEADRDHEDFHGDEEAPTRNVRTPKNPLPEERELVAPQEGTLTAQGLVSSVFQGKRPGGSA